MGKLKKSFMLSFELTINWKNRLKKLNISLLLTLVSLTCLLLVFECVSVLTRQPQ